MLLVLSLVRMRGAYCRLVLRALSPLGAAAGKPR